jgi:hypothetical protein
LILQILAFSFILAVHAIPKKTGLLAGAINRPEILHFRCDKSQKESTILLGWEIPGDGGMIEIAAGFDP